MAHTKDHWYHCLRGWGRLSLWLLPKPSLPLLPCSVCHDIFPFPRFSLNLAPKPSIARFLLSRSNLQFCHHFLLLSPMLFELLLVLYTKLFTSPLQPEHYPITLCDPLPQPLLQLQLLPLHSSLSTSPLEPKPFSHYLMPRFLFPCSKFPTYPVCFASFLPAILKLQSREWILYKYIVPILI